MTVTHCMNPPKPESGSSESGPSETGLSELARRFAAHTLDAASFGHREHVYVAYDLLHHYDFMQASVLYVDGIRTLAANVGADDKFNLTITLAWLSVIAERIASTGPGSCDEFLELNADLLSKDALGKYYSSERLNSDMARRQYLLPDLG